jgi:mannose-6-phosphate isomerase-like protein (cupin superfamily)
MKRRNFLQLPLASIALTSLASEANSQDRPQHGFKVESGKARYQEELLLMGGRFQCKISSKDTGGDLCIYDTFREEKGGPALHIHHVQDEWFYVVKGEFLFQVGESTFNLRPGDSAFGPRKIPHAFAKISDGPGQMLIVWQPAGSMEDFFYQMSTMTKKIPANPEVVLKHLFESHGMEVAGPPLKI